jgi:CheY-like chemotaxis protein
MAVSGRILVIDDDEVVLVAIADLLEDAGFQVHTQASPIGATQTIAREQIDLVVIDLNMPAMQGDTVIRLFRSWDRMRTLPVIVISSADPSTLTAMQGVIPDVAVVQKGEMTQKLVPAVRTALVGAPSVRQGRDKLPDGSTQAKDLVKQLLLELARLAPRLRVVGERQGDENERQSLLDSLQRNRGRAQLMGLSPLAAVLDHAMRAIASLTPGSPQAGSTQQALVRAADGLDSLPTIAPARFAERTTDLALRVERTLSQRL